jgi:large subunit ribosomal protein L13
MAIIDADNVVLGRVASVIAKRLLNGEEIVVVNAEKALILGSREHIINDYLHKRARRHQRKGPFFPKKADQIFKRTVRGMLPYQKPRGREALKRLKVHIGVPPEFEGKKVETGFRATKVPRVAMRLDEVSHSLDPRYEVQP